LRPLAATRGQRYAVRTSVCSPQCAPRSVQSTVHSLQCAASDRPTKSSAAPRLTNLASGQLWGATSLACCLCVLASWGHTRGPVIDHNSAWSVAKRVREREKHLLRSRGALWGPMLATRAALQASGQSQQQASDCRRPICPPTPLAGHCQRETLIGRAGLMFRRPLPAWLV